MGVILCSKHGRRGIALLCPHLEESLRNGALLAKATIVTTELGFQESKLEATLCTACAAAATADGGGAHRSGDAGLDWFFELKTEPVCQACLADAEGMAHGSLFPETALTILRQTRCNPQAACSYEGMSGGLRWNDEFPGEAIEACIRADSWAFRCVWAYRASLIRGQPRDELRGAWDQLARECPEWPGFRPERRAAALRDWLDSEEARFLREMDELDARYRKSADAE